MRQKTIVMILQILHVLIIQKRRNFGTKHSAGDTENSNFNTQRSGTNLREALLGELCIPKSWGLRNYSHVQMKLQNRQVTPLRVL